MVVFLLAGLFLQAAKEQTPLLFAKSGILGGKTNSAWDSVDEDLALVLGSFAPSATSTETYDLVNEDGIVVSSLPLQRESEIKDKISKQEEKPVLKFIRPAQGFNWGKLHNRNGVDIANSCGTAIVAAADGVVVRDKNFGTGDSGWNGGYGTFVLLSHSDGTVTRYAHLKAKLVEIGQNVSQGQKIGLMGSTGNSTGCHLHFEVIGAANPFAK